MIEFAIKIPDDLEPFIAESVKTGAFNDLADLVVSLLYQLRAESESRLSEEHQVKFATLRTEIAVGTEQAARGDFVEFNADEIITEGCERRDAGMAGLAPQLRMNARSQRLERLLLEGLSSPSSPHEENWLAEMKRKLGGGFKPVETRGSFQSK